MDIDEVIEMDKPGWAERAVKFCAAFISAYCKDNSDCKGCPHSTKNGGCKLAENETPDKWDVGEY